MNTDAQKREKQIWKGMEKIDANSETAFIAALTHDGSLVTGIKGNPKNIFIAVAGSIYDMSKETGISRAKIIKRICHYLMIIEEKNKNGTLEGRVIE